MSTAAALFAAIRATPDDDTPRLVYADYLDDARQPERAEFVRAQCERARLPDWDARARALRRRERVLLARHGRAWLAELGAVPGVEWGGFERGFVAEIRVTSAGALVWGAESVQAVAPVHAVTFTTNDFVPGRAAVPLPWLRTIRLTSRDEFEAGGLRALLDSPVAERVRVLNLAGVGVENAGAAAVAAATHLTGLEELDLTNGFVGVAGTAALAGARHLTNLRVLRFDSFGSGYVDDPFVTTEGVRALVESSHLKSLRTLGLAGHGLDAAAVELVFRHPGFARLESVSLSSTEFVFAPGDVLPGPARWHDLDLRYCQLGATTLRSLLALPQLSELRRLRLNGSGVTAEGVRELAGASAAGHLRELDLGNNNFGTGGAQALAAGDWPHLHTLDVSGNAIGAAGAKALAVAAFPALADLRLGENQLNDAGVGAIATARWAGGLRNLSLSQNQFGPVGGRALGAAPALRRLNRLDLSGNPIGSDGVSALVENPVGPDGPSSDGEWPELVELDLGQSKCGDAAVSRLASSTLISQLLALRLSDCDLTPAGVQALVEAADDIPLGELDLNQNTRLKSAGADVLVGAASLPALRSLAVGYCGIDRAALDRLRASPLVQRLLRFQAWGNEMSQAMYPELMARAYTDLGPDWVDDGSVEEDPYG